MLVKELSGPSLNLWATDIKAGWAFLDLSFYSITFLEQLADVSQARFFDATL